MRGVLYPPGAGQQKTATGPALSETEVERRAIIAKAWTLHQQRKTEKELQDLKAKFLSMRLALRVLRRADSRLFRGALARSPDLLFPRRLNPPTETPPAQGWR